MPDKKKKTIVASDLCRGKKVLVGICQSYTECYLIFDQMHGICNLFLGHRSSAFPHIHQPLRVRTRPQHLVKEARDRPRSPKHKKKSKKAEFTPVLDDLKETNGNYKDQVKVDVSN